MDYESLHNALGGLVMRKGDERKQEILTVSERLFCQKGYDATSVQDILDVLHCSKGAFYHHFLSKDAVLDTICTRRAESACERAAAQLSNSENEAPMTRLNLLFSALLPLHREDHSFMAMLLPLLDRAESMAVRGRYQEALSGAFLPLLEQEIHRARGAEVIYPPVKGVCQPILALLNQCWLEAALLLLESVRRGQRHDSSALLAVLEKYRRSIEVLLDAPYGSVVLADYEEWDALAELLLRRLTSAGNS